MKFNKLKLGLCLAILLTTSASAGRNRDGTVAIPTNAPDKVIVSACSAYCSCRYCCGWYLDKAGVARVRGTGKRKAVGKTSSGATARHGTIAVDPKVYPTGTVFYIPGYGYAIAEDRGGAVKGASLELWFSTHKTALIWGRKKVEVKVWYPPGSKLKKKK